MRKGLERMESCKIGAFGAWLEMGVLDSIRTLKEHGAACVQLLAVDALDPLEVEPDQTRLVKKLLKEQGMQLSALAADVGTMGLAVPKENEEKVFHLQKTMELALSMGAKLVTLYPGVLPDDRLDPACVSIRDACQELAKYARKKGGCFALDTGSAKVAALSALVDEVGEGLGINYDPAALVMSGVDDEVAGVAEAGKRILHVQARDCRAGGQIPFKRYCKILADGGSEALYEGGFVTETGIGEGAVRWPQVLAALRGAGYAGCVSIRHGMEQVRDASLTREIEYLQEKWSEIH